MLNGFGRIQREYSGLFQEAELTEHVLAGKEIQQ
jgi:hypothetical protein